VAVLALLYDILLFCSFDHRNGGDYDHERNGKHEYYRKGREDYGDDDFDHKHRYATYKPKQYWSDQYEEDSSSGEPDRYTEAHSGGEDYYAEPSCGVNYNPKQYPHFQPSKHALSILACPMHMTQQVSDVILVLS
jgi:hypothetical protein